MQKKPAATTTVPSRGLPAKPKAKPKAKAKGKSKVKAKASKTKKKPARAFSSDED